MIRFRRDPHLDRLDKIFNFDISSQTPAVFSIFIDSLARASVLFSILATPYILWVLLVKKKFGWLFFFIVFVVGPYLVSKWFLRDSELISISFYIPLAFLVVYMMLLKNTYQDWKEPIFLETPKKQV